MDGWRSTHYTGIDSDTDTTVLYCTVSLRPYLTGRSQQLRAMLHRMHALDDLPVLSSEDASVLELRSRSYLERSHRCNQNARRLADWLQQQPAVQTVYYPGVGSGRSNDSDGDHHDEDDEGDKVFAALARRNPLPYEPSLPPISSSSSEEEEGTPSGSSSMYHSPGRGCLLSIVLKESVSTQVRDKDEPTYSVCLYLCPSLSFHLISRLSHLSIYRHLIVRTALLRSPFS